MKYTFTFFFIVINLFVFSQDKSVRKKKQTYRVEASINGYKVKNETYRGLAGDIFEEMEDVRYSKSENADYTVLIIIDSPYVLNVNINLQNPANSKQYDRNIDQKDRLQVAISESTNADKSSMEVSYLQKVVKFFVIDAKSDTIASKEMTMDKVYRLTIDPNDPYFINMRYNHRLSMQKLEFMYRENRAPLTYEFYRTGVEEVLRNYLKQNSAAK